MAENIVFLETADFFLYLNAKCLMESDDRV